MAPGMFDLDETQLRHADSIKWTHYAADVLPLWIADMDFAISPFVKQALHDRLDRTIGYGHGGTDKEFMSLLRQRIESMGLTQLPTRKWVHLTSGVVQALYAGVLGLTSPGDEVLTMTPIYPPFLSAIADHGRVAVHSPLLDTDAGWRIDFEQLQRSISPRTRLLMLCHPHNPTGRVWTTEELSQLAEIAEERGLSVVCDELHADLTLEGAFRPFVSVASPTLRDRTVTLTGPCKTYNTAGLGIGAMVTHSPSLLKRITDAIRGIGGHPNEMSVAMWRAAMQDNTGWHEQILKALRERRQLLVDFVRDRLDGVRMHAPQATYLAWMDYRQHAHAADIAKHLQHHAKVGLHPGSLFGPGNEGYVRINFATSESILREALERMSRV